VSARFSDRAAAVTGGASGIGYAIAARLAAEGGKVAIWDVNEKAALDSAARLGDTAIGLAVDVADDSSVATAATMTAQRLGGIDILVTSAAITGPNATLAEYPVVEWRRVIDINLNGAFYCNRAVVPHMLKTGYGRIVNIASIAGKEGNPNASAYSASKAALIGLTKSLGKELATYDIAVNAIAPAVARTAILGQTTQQHIDYMVAKIPRGRTVEVGEIAALVAWAASADCSFTTGFVLDISGGRATY
jgi:3-oxoacyl-[acyl-carrier protein] reductase